MDYVYGTLSCHKVDMNIGNTATAHHLCGLYVCTNAYCRLSLLFDQLQGEMKVHINLLRVRIANPQFEQ